MAERVIRIKVVAAADASLRGVFQGLEETADRVHGKLRGEGKKTAAASARDAEKVKREQAKTMDALMGHAQKRRHLEEAHTERMGQLQARGVREHEKAERARTTTQIRESRRRLEADTKVIREVERHERQRRPRGRPILTGARDFGRDVVGPVGRGDRAVMGGVGELARGAGIDWSPGTLMARRLETEDSARRATVSGMASQGKVATQKDVDESMLAVVAAAKDTNTSFMDAAGGLEAFVGKFSDLEIARGVLKDLAVLANASGASIEDLAASAGTIGATLDEGLPSAEKMKIILSSMRQQFFATTRGTVEQKELAQYGPRLAASAGDFGGTYEQNLAELNALAQLALQGGRQGASEATNSAKSVAIDLKKEPMRKRLEAEGIDVWKDERRTQMHSVSDIMTAVYAKTGGDKAKIAGLFKNENSRAAVMALSKTYEEGRREPKRIGKYVPGGGVLDSTLSAFGFKPSEAQRHQGGLEAIKAKFKDLSGTLSPEEVESMGALKKEGKSGQAQGLQNKIEDYFGTGLDKALAEAQRNPEGVATMLGVGIGGAGLLGGILGSFGIGGGGGGGGLFGGGGGGGGGISLNTAAITVAGAVTLAAMGKLAIDSAVADKSQNENEAIKTGNETSNEAGAVVAKVRAGEITPEQGRNELLKMAAPVQADLDLADKRSLATDLNPLTGMADLWDWAGGGGGRNAERSAAIEADQRRGGNENTMARLNEAMAQLIALQKAPPKMQEVRVTNLADLKIPSPDPSRTGPDAWRFPFQ